MKILIGIDADVEKSGVAILTKDSLFPNGRLLIEKKSFFKLFDFLLAISNQRDKYFEEYSLKVYLEAGWLNTKSNWHVSGKGEDVSARVGTKVGANHQVGKLIVEMCEYLKIDYELVQPKTSKIGIRQFRMLTKYEGKLDQDMVDAGCLILGR